MICLEKENNRKKSSQQSTLPIKLLIPGWGKRKNGEAERNCKLLYVKSLIEEGM